MTLSEILYECGELGNQSTRVTLDWKRFVNRAIQRIAQRRDWSFLHDQRNCVIPANQLYGPLDANFKGLGRERTPISYQDPTATYTLPIPVEIISRARSLYLTWNPFLACFPTAPNVFPLRYIFLERNGPGGGWQIWLPTQYTANPPVTFNVSGYYYPNPLVNANDTNAMTNQPELCDAIINLAKALAYRAEGNDPDHAKMAYDQYEEAYKSASYSDTAQKWSGRELKM